MLICAWLLMPTVVIGAQTNTPTGTAVDDSEVKPPVTQTDLQIVRHAREILDSPAKWNRADTRICPADAKTFSLYCALEQATRDVTGTFQHRGAAMQEARFAIEKLVPDWKKYHHRLMDYNNDPSRTFGDIQRVFQLMEDQIVVELRDQHPTQSWALPAPESELANL